MDLNEALAMGMEFAPGDGRGPEALYVLTREVERLRDRENVRRCRHCWPGVSAGEMCECGARRRPPPAN